MFLEYYKLCDQPFGVTPDPRFLYFGSAHREALASLVYSIETKRGFSAMVAEPGMGKTTLLFRLMELLRGSSRTAFLFQTEGDSRDLLRSILNDLGIATQGQDFSAMHEALNAALLEEMRAGRQVVVILDEAQNLDEKSLESIRLLSNFETSTQKLMHIVLAGQPKLGERLAGPDLKQLRQRVSTMVRLDPLSPEETEVYIDWRLRVAGNEGRPLFSPEALDLISRVSKGIPRNINSLCFQALSIGFATQSKTIGAEIMREVVADLDPRPRSSYRANAAPRAAAPPATVSGPAPAREPAPDAPRPLTARLVPEPAAGGMSAAAIWNSWAIAPSARERTFRAKGLAILACVLALVLLILVLSNPRLGLNGTPPGKFSDQVVNAVLSSTDRNSDSVPGLPKGLRSPAAPAIQQVTDTSTITAQAPDDADADSEQPSDTSTTSEPTREQDSLAPVATKNREQNSESRPRERETSPRRGKNSIVQVTHRENLFEFALENYGKSGRMIVDEIRLLNPQIHGTYDMLHAGEWIRLPSEPAAPTSEAQNR